MQPLDGQTHERAEILARDAHREGIRLQSRTARVVDGGSEREIAVEAPTAEIGATIEARLREELDQIEKPQLRSLVEKRMKDIEDSGERDLYF